MYTSLPPSGRRGQASESGNIALTKHDLQMTLRVKVTVHEATNINTAVDGKPLFCVFEVRWCFGF